MADGEKAATGTRSGGSLNRGRKRPCWRARCSRFSSAAPAAAARRTGCSANGPPMPIFTERTRRVDGPSRAGAAPRDDRAKPANLWADRGEIQRSGQDVALAERSSTSLCLSRARRRRGRLPGAQLHAGVCRGAGHVPERLAGSEADGNAALWRGCTLRVSGNRQPRRARTPMGQGALHRPQSCRMGSPKVHV
jgi:hypothetical protein